jgi:hypothetical protein
VRTDLPAPARSGDHGPAVGPREHS